MSGSVAPGSEERKQYERARRKFLRLLDQGKGVWIPTDPNYDLNVELSRIYLPNPNTYLAWMRIRPDGFRAPRKAASDNKIVFHLCFGTAYFMYRDKERLMYPNDYITVAPKGRYAIRCHDRSTTAYFVVEYVDLRVKRSTRQVTRQLAIEPPPSEQFHEPREAVVEPTRPVAVRASQRIRQRQRNSNASSSGSA